MRTWTFFVFNFILSQSIFLAQDQIEVTDQTLKIGGMKEEILYYGFAEGDKILFDFEEIDQKELKEIEIAEWPSTSRFSDFKVIAIREKVIQVNRTGVFVFRFKNDAMKARICKIKIQRIPAKQENNSFNTSVSWVDKYDTTWNIFNKEVLIGYDTVEVMRTRYKELKNDTVDILFLEKNETVHSSLNSNGNKRVVSFVLPINETTLTNTSDVISWGIWVGVDVDGSAGRAWQKNAQLASGVATKVAGSMLGPIGALATGVISYLIIPTASEDVQYFLMDEKNYNLYNNGYESKVFEQGKGAGFYKLMNYRDTRQGRFYLIMINDNEITPVSVQIKISALVHKTQSDLVRVKEKEVKPKYENKVVKEPVITKKMVPVLN